MRKLLQFIFFELLLLFINSKQSLILFHIICILNPSLIFKLFNSWSSIPRANFCFLIKFYVSGNTMVTHYFIHIAFWVLNHSESIIIINWCTLSCFLVIMTWLLSISHISLRRIQNKYL